VGIRGLDLYGSGSDQWWAVVNTVFRIELAVS